jgi:hypothetical protein
MDKDISNPRYTFMSGGTRHEFVPNEPVGTKGITQMTVHARLALEASKSGRRDIYIMDNHGVILEDKELVYLSRGPETE